MWLFVLFVSLVCAVLHSVKIDAAVVDLNSLSLGSDVSDDFGGTNSVDTIGNLKPSNIIDEEPYFNPDNDAKMEQKNNKKSRGKVEQASSTTKVVRKKTSEVVAFYNVYAEGPYYRSIVREQLTVLNNSGLYDKLTKIKYATIGADSSRVLISTKSKYEKIGSFSNGSEVNTLMLLYNYCLQKPKKEHIKVLYFHNKGSFHSSEKNTEFRRALDCFNLNPYCLEALDQYDTCGWRISPVPHIHYSGNMWWSTCVHIRRLVRPDSFEKNVTFSSGSMNIVSPNSTQWKEDIDKHSQIPTFGFGRYFAETWIGSAPSFQPSDCMNSSVDSAYIGGYDIPLKSIYPYCPNVRNHIMESKVEPASLTSSSTAVAGYTKRERAHMRMIKSLQEYAIKYGNSEFKNKFGLRCQNASTLVNPEAFKRKVKGYLQPYYGFNMSERHQHGDRDPLSILIQRSWLWYNANPELLVRWWSMFDKLKS
mmetsp:Transcript_5674/g.8479  ORF Transcript_5674/g.8479 Transcript_5674/m.8479 type:complete len:476 (-) Transcript_5674:1476-2903(-)